MSNNIISCFKEYLLLSGLHDVYVDKYFSLKKEIEKCRACRLANYRKNVVIGEGSLKASLMFIGEAPGEEEDLQGRPFVGKAGELLTRIIHSINLTREIVYITNVVKCHPPGNRNPLPDEVEQCRKFLELQIEIIKPKVICLLGNVPLKTLFPSTKGITIERGKVMRYKEITTIPTFHPAYLLRNEHEKRKVWRDMLLIKSILKEKGCYLERL